MMTSRRLALILAAVSTPFFHRPQTVTYDCHDRPTMLGGDDLGTLKIR
jgi:uncharacterized protein with NRDE domain